MRDPRYEPPPWLERLQRAVAKGGHPQAEYRKIEDLQADMREAIALIHEMAHNVEMANHRAMRRENEVRNARDEINLAISAAMKRWQISPTPTDKATRE